MYLYISTRIIRLKHITQEYFQINQQIFFLVKKSLHKSKEFKKINFLIYFFLREKIKYEDYSYSDLFFQSNLHFNLQQKNA